MAALLNKFVANHTQIICLRLYPVCNHPRTRTRTKTRVEFSNPRPNLGFFELRTRKNYCVNSSSSRGKEFSSVGIQSLDDDDDENSEMGEEEEDSDIDWEAEFVGELDPFAFLPPKKRKQLKQSQSEMLRETDSMDWCVRARKVALRSIEARGLTHTMEDLVTVNRKKKKNKISNKKKFVGSKKNKIKKGAEEGLDFGSDEEDFEEDDSDTIDDLDQIRRNVSMIAGGMFEEKKEKTI